MVDRIDVDQVLDDVDAALLPREQARPADDPVFVRGHDELGAPAVCLPPVRRLLFAQRLRVDGGEGLVDGPVVDPDDRLDVVVGRGPDGEGASLDASHVLNCARYSNSWIRAGVIFTITRTSSGPRLRNGLPS